MTKTKYDIGTKVYIVNYNLEIEEKTIIELINNGKEIKYKLDNKSCGGVTEDDFFNSKAKAEHYKQDFLDNLKFKVGDLVMFSEKSFGRKDIYIGRVKRLYHRKNPYEIHTAYSREYTLDEIENNMVKIKNNYIENFENIKDLYKQFDDKETELRNIRKQIYHLFDNLEHDLKKSFKKQLKWYILKPKFENKFNFQREDY